jgi:hypothetical protein
MSPDTARTLTRAIAPRRAPDAFTLTRNEVAAMWLSETLHMAMRGRGLPRISAAMPLFSPHAT